MHVASGPCLRLSRPTCSLGGGLRQPAFSNLTLLSKTSTSPSCTVQLKAGKDIRSRLCPSSPFLPTGIPAWQLYLLRGYIALHSALVRYPFLWAVLPSMERSGSWTADIMTFWLQTSCVAVGALPPPSFSWTSHSLRTGAASAAVACGVPLQTVKWYGDWARDSSDVVHDNVGASFLPDDPARYWFGWRSPVGPPDFLALLHLGDASPGAPSGLSSPANYAI